MIISAVKVLPSANGGLSFSSLERQLNQPH